MNRIKEQEFPVVINDDMISASDEHGKRWMIRGLRILKDKGEVESYYPISNSFCKAVIWKGMKHTGIKLNETEIDFK